MKAIIFICLTSVSLYVCGQAPGIKMWDQNIGGLQDDIPTCFLETDDGGYLIGGYSYSGNGGDKSQAARGAADYWVVRLDASGNVLWDKTFGGSGNDHMHCIIEADGGYLLGGMSASSQSGDRSQFTWGNHDYWIIKIDDSGNKIWDKSYGGSSSDQLFAMVEPTTGECCWQAHQHRISVV
jgi:hypothetical protein